MKLHFAGPGIFPYANRDCSGNYWTGYINLAGFYALKERTYFNQQGELMDYATAWYVAEPYAEIYVFVDEPPSDLPEGAICIVDEKEPESFLGTLQPYFVMAADS